MKIRGGTPPPVDSGAKADKAGSTKATAGAADAQRTFESKLAGKATAAQAAQGTQKALSPQRAAFMSALAQVSEEVRKGKIKDQKQATKKIVSSILEEHFRLKSGKGLEEMQGAITEILHADPDLATRLEGLYAKFGK